MTGAPDVIGANLPGDQLHGEIGVAGLAVTVTQMGDPRLRFQLGQVAKLTAHHDSLQPIERRRGPAMIALRGLRGPGSLRAAILVASRRRAVARPRRRPWAGVLRDF